MERPESHPIRASLHLEILRAQWRAVVDLCGSVGQAGNGMTTIEKGTLPLAVFRSEAEHKALRARLCCRDRVVPREVGQVRPNRPPASDFRFVNSAGYLPLVRPNDQAEEIVKSEGGTALKLAEYPTYSH